MLVVVIAPEILRPHSSVRCRQAHMPVGAMVPPSCHDVQVLRVIAPDTAPDPVVPPCRPVVAPPVATASATALRPVAWLPEGVFPMHYPRVIPSPHLHVRSQPAKVHTRPGVVPPPCAAQEALVPSARVSIAEMILGPATHAAPSVAPSTEHDFEHWLMMFSLCPPAIPMGPPVRAQILLAHADVCIIGACDPH